MADTPVRCAPGNCSMHFQALTLPHETNFIITRPQWSFNEKIFLSSPRWRVSVYIIWFHYGRRVYVRKFHSQSICHCEALEIAYISTFVATEMCSPWESPKKVELSMQRETYHYKISKCKKACAKAKHSSSPRKLFHLAWTEHDSFTFFTLHDIYHVLLCHSDNSLHQPLRSEIAIVRCRWDNVSGNCLLVSRAHLLNELSSLLEDKWLIRMGQSLR